MEKVILNVNENRQGRVGQIFKMKDKITGGKKASTEPHAIEDPKTNNLLVSNQDIRKATLEYCADNLRNREPDPEVKSLVSVKNLLVEEKLKEKEEPLEIDKNDYNTVLTKFKAKASYDFLVKASDNFQDAIFKLCRRMIKEEEFPDMFRRTLLYMIWKQKGPANILKNNRFIHLKEHYLPRTVEALVVNKIKSDIFSKSTMFQVGGQPGHSIEEHLFTIKSMIEWLEKKGQGMIFTLVDLVAFFDRETIHDVMSTLYDVGVNNTAARLWYKLNQDTEIRVKTSAGMTDSAFVGDVIGQGTAGAALMSQLNLEHGLKNYFSGSADEMYYGTVRCEYFAYQDDIGKPSAGVNQAQAANIKMSHVFQEKGLEAHPDKTGYIVFGTDTYKREVSEQLKYNELSLGGFLVKRKEYDRYLGQILHTDGNRASAEATIKERGGKIKGAMFEVKSVVEDFQMQAIGGMMSAWELWEKAMVPSLLSGAGTWTQITEKEVDICDKLQDMFWRIMLEVPESCPRIALRAETRMISMKYRIWQQKLLLLKRIRGQSPTTLSRKVLEEQKENDWPGLSREVRDICEELGIPDLNVNEMTANHIETAIIDHHDRNMMEEIAKSKKMMRHKNDDFSKVQNYLKGKALHNCRMGFRIRCELVKDIKWNFKDKYRRRGRGGCLDL